ncbi:MAG: DsbE family thiol:disulfide interchange protein [Betaproteobacteria bacterium]|nr:DsbE family thiol:disulfide interchange protein [Betaproteobacteria bacterium]
MTKFLLPLGGFIAIFAFLFIGLGLNPREVPSPFIGKAAPTFELGNLHRPDSRFGTQDMAGKVWLLNVWASWCVACRDEHPLLVDLAKQDTIPIVGLNYKDKQDQALAWLKQFGNPYRVAVMDADGRIGIDFGVYGVPETFLIDKKGIIRFKHIGPITKKAWEEKMLPLVRELQKS